MNILEKLTRTSSTSLALWKEPVLMRCQRTEIGIGIFLLNSNTTQAETVIGTHFSLH